MIALQEIIDGEAAVTTKHPVSIGPTVLSYRGHQLACPLHGQAIIGGAQAAASALALVLETHRPIRALDPQAIGLHTRRPEQVELLSPANGFANVYAICCIHAGPGYAKTCYGSSGIVNGKIRQLYQATLSYAKICQGDTKPTSSRLSPPNNQGG